MLVRRLAQRATAGICSFCVVRCTQLRFITALSQHDRSTQEGLKILFCGADHFSIASLRALLEIQREPDSPIRTIDVLCRPDKRVGPRLRKIQEVPIKSVARSCNLSIHEIEDFKQYMPEKLSSNINLIIAVSFGLLIPAEVIAAAKYGGLNVHPSLLPDLRGAAPIHHALLNRRSHTGVTVQTLHPTKFDHGQILAQTALPGLAIPASSTPATLLPMLAAEGANLLRNVINTRSYISPAYHKPLTEREIMLVTDGNGIAPAPRFRKDQLKICWRTMTAEHILLRHHVFGRLWDDSTSQLCLLSPTPVRVLFDKIVPVKAEAAPEIIRPVGMLSPGSPCISADGRLFIHTVDGALLEVLICTIANEKVGQGRDKIVRTMRSTMLEC